MYCIPIPADMRNDDASPCHIYSRAGMSYRVRKAKSAQRIAIENGSAPRLARSLAGSRPILKIRLPDVPTISGTCAACGRLGGR